MLPPGRTIAYRKGQIIYDSGLGASDLYYVTEGLVLIALADCRGEMAITRFVGPSGLFGESSLGERRLTEMALALQPSRVRCWDRNEVLGLALHNGALATSLTRHLAMRSNELRTRLASTRLRLAERLALALVELAQGLGTPQETGRVRLHSLTHATLADYVGAARELVTKELIRLRRDGLIDYAYGRIDVDVPAAREYLGSGTSCRVLPAGRRTDGAWHAA